jgi:hypothetical protein
MSRSSSKVLRFDPAAESSSEVPIDYATAESSGPARLEEISSALAELRERLAPARIAFLHSLGEPGLRLRMPLAIAVVDEREQSVASLDEFDLYGDGDTPSEAVEHLRRLFLEEYRHLLANESRLGPLPLSHLARMRELVEEV